MAKAKTRPQIPYVALSFVDERGGYTTVHTHKMTEEEAVRLDMSGLVAQQLEVARQERARFLLEKGVTSG